MSLRLPPQLSTSRLFARVRPWTRWALALCVGLVAAGAAQAQSGDTFIVKRDTQLRRAAAENAPVIAPLAGNSTVQRLAERQGAWVRVRANNQLGWVHMFDLGSQPSASSGGGTNVLRGLGSLFGSGSQTTTATSTVGIRGLDADDIANAQPNPAAVKRGEALRANPSQAQQFAARSGLRAQSVDDLPAP